MVSVIGSFIHDCSMYDQPRLSLLEVVLYRILFRTMRTTNDRLYHAVQYHYIWKRTQYWRSRIRYPSQVFLGIHLLEQGM
jgi:hypothetical protein